MKSSCAVYFFLAGICHLTDHTPDHDTDALRDAREVVSVYSQVCSWLSFGWGQEGDRGSVGLGEDEGAFFVAARGWDFIHNDLNLQVEVQSCDTDVGLFLSGL